MAQGNSVSDRERPEADASDALIRRFPERAGSIGRLRAEDPRFGAICEDYAEAQRALAYWLAVGHTGQRAEEYRQMVGELETEALAALTAYESLQG